MAEKKVETKTDEPLDSDTKKSQEKEEDPKKKLIDVDLDTVWKCRKCSISNPSNVWTCSACYAPRSLTNKKLRFIIPELTKCLIKEKSGIGYEYKTIKIPEIEEDELLIKSYATGICGSDLILYNWTKDAETIAKLPFIPGHETSGLVVKSGKKTRIKVGSRVAIENHFYCDGCYLCSINRQDICCNLNQFGHGKGTTQGGCSQYFKVKEKYCYRLRSAISWRDAALLEPMGVAMNACIQADCDIKNTKKENVLIIGCGTIGLLAIGILSAKKYTNIIAMDIIDEKLNIAKKMGATHVINSLKLKNVNDIKNKLFELTNNTGVGKLIDCSGNVNMINNCFTFVRKGANIVLVGLPKKDLNIVNPMKELIFKSITLRTIHGRRIFDTWIKSEDLVKKGKINLDLIMSKTYNMVPLSKYKDVFKAFASGKELKIVFDPQK